jgi:hypothetical protein
MHRVLALSFLGVLKGIAEWGGFMGVLTVMGEGYGVPHAGVPEIVTPHTPHPSQSTAHELSELGSIRIRFQHPTCYL